MNSSMTSSALRVLFAGTPDFAATCLQSLLDFEGVSVEAVLTQPDRPAGRGKKIVPGPVKQLAKSQGLPVLQPLTLKQQDIQEALRAMNIDVMVVVAYGLILPKEVLHIPRLGCINVHASLLPRWRGAAPIQRAIEAGDTETGITIMQMDEGLDTGPMLGSKAINIDPLETGGSLHDRLAAEGGPTLIRVLSELQNNPAMSARQQDDAAACYAEKISKAEAAIDWSVPARDIERRIRAFNPFPVCYFSHPAKDNQTIRVWSAELLNEVQGTSPGTIMNVSGEGIDVSCGEGVLRLKELQMPGKTRQSAAAIINGYKGVFKAGIVLS
jgi:methionyl-tRNA formyltransferase